MKKCRIRPKMAKTTIDFYSKTRMGIQEWQADPEFRQWNSG